MILSQSKSVQYFGRTFRIVHKTSLNVIFIFGVPSNHGKLCVRLSILCRPAAYENQARVLMMALTTEFEISICLTFLFDLQSLARWRANLASVTVDWGFVTRQACSVELNPNKVRPTSVAEIDLYSVYFVAFESLTGGNQYNWEVFSVWVDLYIYLGISRSTFLHGRSLPTICINYWFFCPYINLKKDMFRFFFNTSSYLKRGKIKLR